MIIGHIGVRKGSKGVPGKNFRPLCGRPLIDWSLDQLLNHAEVDTVVVSTDSEEILAHAIKRGCLDIGLRPAHLATDSAGRVYVSDPEGYRVLIFSPAGAYLGRFGQYGTDTGSLGLPNGLAVGPDDSLWVADAGNHRVLGYAPVFGAAEPLLVEPTVAAPGSDEAYPAGDVDLEPTIAE